MKISYISEKLDDLKLVSRWYFEEWGHLDSSMTEEKIYEGLSSKLDKDDDFLCLVTVHEKEELVAVVDLKYREHKDYPEYVHWIGGVFVKPEYRGRGYAGILIDQAKVHTSKLGIPKLYLQCEEHNEGLYLKYGFKPLQPAVYFGVKTTIFEFNTRT